jgi:hypothetical protein
MTNQIRMRDPYLPFLQRWIHRTTARIAEPVLIVRIELERLVTYRAREPSAVEEDREVRRRGVGGISMVAHCGCVLCRCLQLL